MAALGATFGKYFLSEKIATGGMAEIYLAKLIGPGGFEKQLVLKLIHPELSEHRQFVQMFVAEAKTLVSLTHGNIVPVYELGVHDGTYFLAMEYIDGPALAALDAELEDAGELLSPSQAAYITAELLKGLDYAHRKGESVIHRDISPRNVMLSREGEVKLVDFGLAVTELSQKTRQGSEGLPAGSFPYMSPEQVRQEPLDRTTDLFSAGIILWEMLTGRHLFHRDSADDTLEAVLSADIPAPSSLRPELPKVLDRICAKALARDRDQRYSSASAFLADINKFLYSLDSPPSPEDLAKLVARRAPIRHRRAADADSESGDDQVLRTKPMETGGVPNGTAPMPTASRGKRRQETATFATNAAFEDIVAKATPLFPIQAIDDPSLLTKRPQTEPGTSEEPPPARELQTSATAEQPAAPLPGGNWVLRAVGLLALVSAGVGIGLMLASGQESTRQPDAATAATAPIDAASPADAPPAPPPPDAAPPPEVADAAASKTTVDAARPRRVDAAPAAPKGKGTLKVGARPWADVYVDGDKLGQAPGQWTIPAGKHQVELRYPGPDGERKKSFSIALDSNGVSNLGVVDFTKP
jgi:serine/threonine-protein kinase